jgi:group I intron endonuclease
MAELTGYIYKITNNVTGDLYIGQTRQTINKRYINHKSEARRTSIKSVLYDSMREYGFDNFEVSCVSEIKAETKEDLSTLLNAAERTYIEQLKPAYNSAPGVTGVPWTDERKEKFKELMSGENNPCFGKTKSDETRKKLSDALKGRVISEESRKKTSQTMKGTPKSEETKQRMKEAANNRSYKPPSGKDHHNSKSIDQFDLQGNLIKTFESIGQAAKELSLQTNGICLCCKGRLKTSGGYIFKYTTKHEGLCDKSGLGDEANGGA